jgi:hypothetical protein
MDENTIDGLALDGVPSRGSGYVTEENAFRKQHSLGQASLSKRRRDMIEFEFEQLDIIPNAMMPPCTCL